MSTLSNWTQPDEEYDLLELGYEESNFGSDYDPELDTNLSTDESDTESEDDRATPGDPAQILPVHQPDPQSTHSHPLPVSEEIVELRAAVQRRNRKRMRTILNEFQEGKRKELSEKHWYFIFALRYQAGWSVRRVAQALGLPNSTIGDIGPEEHELTRKPRPGPASKLTAAQRQQLIRYATTNSHTRRLPLVEVARRTGIVASPQLLRKTFAQEGYHRRVARQKPFLSAINKEKRFQFAVNYLNWTVQDWARVLWTDESSFNIGGC